MQYLYRSNYLDHPHPTRVRASTKRTIALANQDSIRAPDRKTPKNQRETSNGSCIPVLVHTPRVCGGHHTDYYYFFSNFLFFPNTTHTTHLFPCCLPATHHRHAPAPAPALNTLPPVRPRQHKHTHTQTSTQRRIQNSPTFLSHGFLL